MLSSSCVCGADKIDLPITNEYFDLCVSLSSMNTHSNLDCMYNEDQTKKTGECEDEESHTIWLIQQHFLIHLRSVVSGFVALKLCLGVVET